MFLWDGAHAMPRPAAITALIASLLAPVSYWRHGPAGAGIVVAGTATIILSFWLATRLTEWLSRSGQVAASLFAATGLRIVLPLALVLAIAGSSYVPPRTLLYLVPLYLTMLSIDTATAARGLRHTPRQPDLGKG